MRRAALAGCTQIQHGVFADDPTLRLLAARDVYFVMRGGRVYRNEAVAR
jgi:hypothetical protein